MHRLFQEAAKVLIVISAVGIPAAFFAADVLPQPEPRFKGKISASVKDSVPDWPQAPKAPTNAPNIVVILLDDIGFADTSTFGGMAQTPELDRLAAQGLRYINFNVTGMCSPTRAALLTGRNHHRVGFGIAEWSRGFPGYDFIWKKDTVSVADVLRRNGYSTAVFGKWHNTPYYEVSPAGPFDRWPTGLGFEYFYGFIAGRDSQWEPSSLFRNTTPVEAQRTPEQGYHFTTDITDEAISWLRTHESLASDKPYFLYFAPGAVHSPHHVAKKWIEKYRSRFDQGWDHVRQEVFARQKQVGVIPADAELTPRPKEVPAWDSLSADQKRLYARQMEVYAGFIAHTDYEIGRLLKATSELAAADNTLIFYVVGDNGAGPPGGPDGRGSSGVKSVAEQLKHIDELGGPALDDNYYALGWTWLGSTPFQWWKTIPSHFGGTRVPLVLSWPARIKQGGGVRRQFTHVNDVASTIYEVTGIRFPSIVDGVKQQPLDGVSFVRTFDHPDELSHRRTQYFEMLGNRAIYQDGWVAAARHRVAGLQSSAESDFTQDRWELYQVEKDFSEVHDLAAQYPDKLTKLKRLFDSEARKNDVYPLDRTTRLSAGNRGEPSLTASKSRFDYYPGMPRLQFRARPPLPGKSFRIAAHAIIPESGAEGVIVSYGGRESGFALYAKDNRLIYENHRAHDSYEFIKSRAQLPSGDIVLGFEYKQESTSEGVGWYSITSTGMGRLSINGEIVGESKLTQTLSAGYDETFGVGQAFGPPVSVSFRPPFKFTGALGRVTVEIE